jgi:ribosomal protein L39E
MKFKMASFFKKNIETTYWIVPGQLWFTFQIHNPSYKTMKTANKINQNKL